MVASHTPPTGDLAHNLGMCPDWEWNRRPFGLQLMLNPLSHTSQGCFLFLIIFNCVLGFPCHHSSDNDAWEGSADSDTTKERVGTVGAIHISAPVSLWLCPGTQPATVAVHIFKYLGSTPFCSFSSLYKHALSQHLGSTQMHPQN